MNDERDLNFYTRTVITSADGSPTLYLPALDETYHSRHGAVQESLHVFIGAGLKAVAAKNEIQILEVGFGTGLNAFLTYKEAEKNNLNIRYTSLEAYPLSLEEAIKLNFSQTDEEKKFFLSLHETAWDTWVQISTYFTLRKCQLRLEDFTTSERFNLIYFDAFAPRVQPELWTEEVFSKLYYLMQSGGILVTYCSKGDVRRAMQAAGFQVEKLAGPPGKREILRATRK